MRQTYGGHYLSMIARIDHRVLEKLMKEKGLTAFNGPQGRILFVLWRMGEIPVKTIVKETGLAKTTLSSMLERMEQQNLIRRSPNPEDGRSYVVGLTDYAKRLQPTFEEISYEMNAIFYRGFTEEEIEEVEHFFKRIYENFLECEVQEK